MYTWYSVVWFPILEVQSNFSQFWEIFYLISKGYFIADEQFWSMYKGCDLCIAEKVYCVWIDLKICINQVYCGLMSLYGEFSRHGYSVLNMIYCNQRQTLFCRLTYSRSYSVFLRSGMHNTYMYTTEWCVLFEMILVFITSIKLYSRAKSIQT